MADDRKVRIKIRDLHKSFKEKDGQTLNVINGLNLDVYENEFLVVLGPGQCGKTVLLNMMAGLSQPDSGTIEFSGGTPAKGDIGVVFQRYALFPWKTVLGNVEASQRFKGVSKSVRTEEAKELIKLVGLDGFEKSYPAALSGGMKQRVGIARAYATKADIMLMDEPFGALDAQTRYQMQNEILKIWQSKLTTVVFVTNNVEEAVYLGDRIVLMGNKPSIIENEFIPNLERPRNNLSHEFLEMRNKIADKMDLALV